MHPLASAPGFDAVTSPVETGLFGFSQLHHRSQSIFILHGYPLSQQHLIKRLKETPNLSKFVVKDQTLMIVPVIGFGRGLLYFGGGLTRKKEERKKEISLALMKSRRARHFRWSKKTQKMHKFKSFHLYQLVIAFDLPKKLQQEYDETFVKYIGQCTCHVFKRVRLRVATL